MRRLLCLVICGLLGCGLCREAGAAVYLGNFAEGWPTCDNRQIIVKVREKIAAYMAEHPASGVVESRRQKLLLKNLHDFTAVSPVDFTSKDDLLTANRLIMLKINEGYTDTDFLVCKSSGDGKKYNIYLLIYPLDNGDYNIEIINFLPPEKSGEQFSVIY